MKVILLQDVARIGRRFEVKDVPDGHALNFLIPRKMAEPASGQSLKRLLNIQNKERRVSENADAAFAEALLKLNGRTVEMPVDANEKGHLFKGIRAEEIVEHVRTQEGVSLSARHIVVEGPLKDIGEHQVKLVGKEAEGAFTLMLVSNNS